MTKYSLFFENKNDNPLKLLQQGMVLTSFPQLLYIVRKNNS